MLNNKRACCLLLGSVNQYMCLETKVMFGLYSTPGRSDQVILMQMNSKL